MGHPWGGACLTFVISAHLRQKSHPEFVDQGRRCNQERNQGDQPFHGSIPLHYRGVATPEVGTSGMANIARKSLLLLASLLRMGLRTLIYDQRQPSSLQLPTAVFCSVVYTGNNNVTSPLFLALGAFLNIALTCREDGESMWFPSRSSVPVIFSSTLPSPDQSRSAAGPPGYLLAFRRGRFGSPPILSTPLSR